MKLNLLVQIVMLITVVVLINTILINTLFSSIIYEVLKGSMGQQALNVAKLAAQNKDIIQAFEHENPSSIIQPISQQIRRLTGASYVVIGNRQGIRYSHHNPEYIGKPMGTSNEAVFRHRKAVIYEGVGVSGPAIKAKVPIQNKNGEIIGVSSVGFLINDIEKKATMYRIKISKISLLVLIIGVTGAFLIAHRVKTLIFGLEPEEISFLFKEKEAILESIRDAIIAVNTNNQIVSMNRRARELFQDDSLGINSPLTNFRIKEIIQEVIHTKKVLTNRKILLGPNLYIIDSSPILEGHNIKGVVMTVRTASEVERLTNEVSKIKAISDNIRAQNHEYLNKLNVIYGLLCLKQYGQAMELISVEVRERQDLMTFLVESVKDPLVAASLLGKMNWAKERKVSLEIDRNSNLTSLPPTIDSKLIVTILGNIIDNAIDAAQERNGLQAKVRVSFTDLGPDIVFDIDDNGSGIPEGWEQIIFSDGFTTKNGENRGLGLALVKSSIDLLKGQLYIGKSDLGGARFTVIIPKFTEEVVKNV
ncbi:ATP-binding protein [Geobacillus subterraneus]|uniref:ATP-binding protein n=1 Tax=Geobacillus subterraneus TaxID=129338 RepID=UPI0035CF448C